MEVKCLTSLFDLIFFFNYLFLFIINGVAVCGEE